ncbi:MAG: hypothetical protein ACFFE1_17465 [Candidatus Thorarchaeota archaeon]
MNRRGIIILLVIAMLLPYTVDAGTTKPREIHMNATIDVWVDVLGSYNYYWNNLGKDYTINIDIEVTSGNDIDFYIVDEENYDLWQDNQDAYAEVIKENIGSVSQSFTVPSSGEWHLLFINDNWLFRKHIEGTVTVTSPPMSNDLSLDAVIGTGLILILVFVVIGCISNENKKKQSRDISQQPIYHQSKDYGSPRAPQNVAGYCPYCGTPKPVIDAVFCVSCGRHFDGPDLR